MATVDNNGIMGSNLKNITDFINRSVDSYDFHPPKRGEAHGFNIGFNVSR